MAIVRPPLAEVVEAIRSDADAILGGIDARLERGLVEVILLAQAGGIHGAYGFLQRIADDTFADTATSAALERIASTWGISRGAATFAAGWIGNLGGYSGVIPVDTILRRGDGLEFTIQASYVNAAGNTIVTNGASVPVATAGASGTGSVYYVRATDSGAAGNTLAAATLALVSPIAGVAAGFDVRDGLSGAVDFELDSALRSRVLARLRNPPQGGTKAEYEAWALGASSVSDPVTRAFVFSPAAGSNVVAVYIVDDGGAIPSANPPTPSAQAILNVEAAIDLRRPISADRNVLAPTMVALTMTIAISPDLPTTRTAIENEIDSFLFDNHIPGQEIAVSIMQAVVSNAAGGADAQITSPVQNWTPAPGSLQYRGAITWV